MADYEISFYILIITINRMNIDDILQMRQFQDLGAYLASERRRNGDININDFLKQKQFQVLDEYLTSEMNRTAGDSLVAQMNKTLRNLEMARDWYFSNNRALGERPYDVCKRGNSHLVKDVITRLDHGMYS